MPVIAATKMTSTVIGGDRDMMAPFTRVNDRTRVSSLSAEPSVSGPTPGFDRVPYEEEEADWVLIVLVRLHYMGLESRGARGNAGMWRI